MTAPTLSQYLVMLESNPLDGEALQGIRDLAGNASADRLGDEPIRSIELARAKHDGLSDYIAIAALLELEISLVSDNVDLLVALYRELARVRRDELLDDAGARAAWKQIVEWKPDDVDAEETLEELDRMPETFRQVADKFVEEAGKASEPSLRAGLLARSATLIWKYKKKGKNKEIDELFAAAQDADPGNLRTARLWAHTLRSRNKRADAGAVLLAAATASTDKAQRVSAFLHAGRELAAAGDQDKAAQAFEQVQDFQPGHEGAMAFLVPYFTEREMFDHLVALYEDALRSRKATNQEQAYLLQLGMVHWRMRNAPAEAEVYFGRLRKLDPAHPGMLAFYREYLGEQQDQSGKLLTILGDAQRSVGGGEQKIELLLEVARKAESSEQHERAIDAWKSVQRIDATNDEAREALKRLYRKAEKWNALAEVLKLEADACTPEQKSRKVGLLRELVAVYRDKLKMDAMVATTYNAIAELSPEDDDALDRLIATYEQMGRWNDLVQVLTRKVEQSTGEEKIPILMRVARLWIDRFANFNKATEPLESVLAIDPRNREAIDLLKDIYNRKRSWKQLFDVQLREVDLEEDVTKRREMQVELARIAGERLHRHGDAIGLWKQIVVDDPNTDGALDALEKLGEREKDWEAVVIALEHRVSLAGNDADRIKHLTKLGSVVGDQQKDPAAAADAWKRILRLDPKNGRALRTLRESFLAARDWEGLEGMYAEASDWEGLVDVFGSAADREPTAAGKVELSFRAAEIYEQRIGEPSRAFRSYERVLAADPTNARAASRLAEIYEADEKWPRLAQVLEVVYQSVDPKDAGERARVAGKLRDIHGGRLGDPQTAFTWSKRAYEAEPTDDEVVAGLERSAAAAHAYEELSSAYDARLSDTTDPDERLELRRRLASIAGEKLGRTEEAVTQLLAIVEAAPSDLDSVDALDRIYRAANRHEDRRQLYLRRIERSDDPAARFVLLTELSELEEKQLNDLEGSAKHRKAVLEIDPMDRGALAALDRLLVALGKDEELASVIERRVEVAESDAERVQLFQRLGDIRRTALGDLDAAVLAYESALTIDATNEVVATGLAAIEANSEKHALEVGRLLEPFYERKGRARELSAILSRRLASTTDEDDKRELRLRIADIASSSLGDPSAAYRSLESAFLDRPGDVDLWDRITAAAENADRVEELVKAFQLGLESGSVSEDDATELARRTASLFEISLGRAADAEPFHKRVLAADQSDDGAFLALKELYTNAERWDDLQALYRTRIDATYDAEQKSELLRQVCFVFEEILDDPERAISSYRELAELDPENEGVRRALEKLYRRTDRPRDLLEILERDLERTEGTRATELAYEIGSIHETKLSEWTKAVDYYERVVEQNPAHVKSVEALERMLERPETRLRVAELLEPIHERSGQFAKLAKDLEIELSVATDPGERVAKLLRLARIREDRLRDPDTAFAAVAEAVGVDPADVEVRSQLGRLADLRRDHAARATVLESALDKADDDLRRELLREIAELWDQNVGDVQKAEAAYVRVIEASPDDSEVVLDASRALERLHIATGDQKALAADLRRQITHENDDSIKSALLVRLGDIFELSLDDVNAAIASHVERTELDPSDATALHALERLYERTSQWEKLAQVLKAREDLTESPLDQRDLAMRVASLEETRLERPDDAIATYADVVARFGRDTEALVALTRLHRAAGRFQDLFDDYEMLLEGEEDPRRRADLRFAAAEVQRGHLNETERALESYAEVLELAPGHPGAVEALEDVLTGSDPALALAAARLVAPEFERAGQNENLLSALDVVATSDDPVEKLAALRKASVVAESGTHELERAFAAESKAAEIAAGEPDLPEILARLETLAARTGKHREHVTLLSTIAPEIMDADTQLATSMRVAEIARTKLSDLDLAHAWYVRALENAPEHRPALDALDSLLVERGEHAELLETLRRKVDLALSDDERIGSLLRIAELCEKHLEDLPSAIDALEQIVNERPLPTAFESLERLYGKTERHGDLAALYEREIELGIGDPRDVRHRLAAVRLDALGDADGAFEAIAANLESGAHEASVAFLYAHLADETHRATVATLLEPVYTQQMNWTKVVEVIEARLTVEQDGDERKVILRRLGQLHEDYREDLASAFDAYARLFREDVADEGVWELLGRLARAQNGYDRFAAVLDSVLAEHDSDDEVTTKLAELAGRTYDERLGAPERATPFFARALRFDPTNQSVFVALESTLTRTSEWTKLVDVYREQSEIADSDDARIDLLHRLANVELSQLAHVEEAVAAHRQVLDIRPDDAMSVRALDSIFTEKERFSDLADLLRFRIDASADVAARSELRHRLGELLASRLTDVSGAIDVFEEVLAEAPHLPTVASLERLVMDVQHRLRITQILEPVYRQTDEWRKLIAIWEAQVELHDDAADKLRLLLEVGRLHENRGRDLGMAFDAYSRAFALDPSDPEPRAEVERVATMANAWNELVQSYERAFVAADDAAQKADLLRAIATVHDQRRGDPRSAIETYERLLTLDPNDASPLESLEALHTLVGDWAGLVRVLERKVDLVYDGVERAEILRRAASVTEELIGDPVAAATTFRRAAEEDPQDPIALESLDRLLSEAGDHVGTADILERRIEVETDDELRRELGLRLAELAEGPLAQRDRAIAALVRVREVHPDDVTMLAGLSRLYAGTEQWPELLDVLRAQIEAASGEAKVELSFRAGDVLETKLGEVHEAIESYRDALAIDPAHAGSIAALIRIVRSEEFRDQAAEIVEPLLRSQNRWEDAATVLALRAETTSDPVDKRDLLRELANVHENGRGDRRAAFDAMRAALAEDAGDPSLFDEVERLGSMLSAHGDVADALAMRASAAPDPETAKLLYERVARIAEGPLGDDARAIEAFERALEQVGEDEAILVSLDRLYTRTDQAPELARVIERRIDGTTDPALRTELLLRVGALRRDRFHDLRGAFSAFQEVVEADPAQPVALAGLDALATEPSLAEDAIEALESAHRRTGALDKLPALFELRFGRADAVSDKVRVLQDRAALEENEIGRPADALVSQLRAFELDPRDESVLGESERLAESTGEWSRLAAALERILASDASDRELEKSLSFRVAGIYLDRLGDRTSGETNLRRTIAADAEAFDAHERLAGLLRDAGRPADLVPALVAWAEADSDEVGKKDRLREAATLAETALGSIPIAVDAYVRWLDVDGSDPDALAGLSRARAAEGKHADVAELLVRRIDVEMDPVPRLALRRELAALYAGPLADVAKATEAYEAVLEEDPESLETMSVLEGLYESSKRWDDLRGLVERRFDLARTDSDRVAAKVRLARLEEQAFGRREVAIEQLVEILELDPHHVEAQDELERLLGLEGKWDEYVERLEARIARASGDEAVRLLGRLALVHRDERNAPAEAIATYERVLAIDPRNEAAQREVLALHRAAGDSAAVADSLERLLGILSGPAAIEVAIELASIAEGTLGDAARAESSLRRALSEDPRHAATRAALRTLVEKQGRYADVANLLAEEAEWIDDPAKKVEAYRAISKLYLDKLEDPASAASYLEQASRIRPEDRDILLPLCDLYVAAGRGNEAVPVLRQIIASFGTKRTKELAGFHHRLGRALESAGDDAGALEQFDAAFKIDLQSIAVLRDLGKITYRMGDFDRSQRTFRALLLQKLAADSGITKGDVYFYLGDMTAKLGDKPKAISMLERAIAEDKGHANAQSLLDQLKA